MVTMQRVFNIEIPIEDSIELNSVSKIIEYLNKNI